MGAILQLSLLLLTFLGFVAYDGGSGNTARILQEIIVEPADAEIAVGQTQVYTATGVYNNGSREDISTQVEWETDNPDVASVDTEGVATALQVGQTQVIASQNEIDGRADLVVVEKILTRLNIFPPSALLNVGTTKDYRAIAVYSDRSLENVTFDVTWSLAEGSNILAPYNPEEASSLSLLDDFETAIAVEVGSDTLVAEFEGVSAESAVEVQDATLTSISIAPPSETVLVGGTVQYAATGIYSDGRSHDLTDVVIWASDDDSIGTISNSSPNRGQASALAAGVTNIQASFEGLSDATDITVIDGDEPGNPITKIDVFPVTETIIVGASQQFRAIAYLQDGTAYEVTEDAQWASSDDNVATISNESEDIGTAQAKAAGTTSITATFSNVQGTAQLNVSPVTLQQIVVEPADSVMFVGTLQQFEAIGIFSNGTSRVITDQVTWGSENQSVLQVSNSDFFGRGLGAALAEGVTVVSAGILLTTDLVVGFVDVTVKEQEISIDELVVAPVQANVLIGDTQQYTATLRLSNGTDVDVTEDVAWTTSSKTVAHIDAAGLATGVSEGESTITATLVVDDESYTGSGTLTVKAPGISIDEIRVTPPRAEIFIGDTQDYTATALLNDGTSVDITDAASWSSSDSTVAQVDAEGVATGVGEGTSTISATIEYEGILHTGSAPLTVKAPDITIEELVVSPPRAGIFIDDTQSYTATVRLSDGSSVDATRYVTWSSSETDVAHIDSRGVATGLAQGESTITSQLNYEGELFSGNALLEVKEGEVTVKAIKVDPPLAEILIDSTQTYEAYALLSDGSRVDITENVTWSSSNTSIAHIDAAGVATGLSEGSSDITATLNYQGEVFSGSAILRVKAPEVTIEEIQVTPSTAEILIGVTQQYTATAILSDGSDQDITRDATWSSSDTAVCQVDNKGLATGLSEGESTLTATLNYEGESFSDTASITVKAPEITIDEIVVDPARAEVIVGSTVAYTAYAVLSDGSNVDVTAEAAWSSSDTTVAHIDSMGVATGLSEGNSTLTATLNFEGEVFRDTARITVKPPEVTIEEIQVTPAVAEILVEGTQQFTATALLSDGTHVDVTGEVTWSSSDSSIASITPNTGLARGLAAGEVNILAVLIYEGETFEGDAQLEVHERTPVFVEINPANELVEAGTSVQYSAIVHFNDGSRQDVTKDITWQSSDTSVATIANASGSEGLATALSAGETAILATYMNVEVGRTNLTVEDAVIVSLEVFPTEVFMAVGTTEQLTAIATYSDEVAQDVTADASWVSADPDVATVGNGDSSGLVTGVSIASTTVTVTFEGIATNVPVDVGDPIPVSAVVRPESVQLDVNMTQQFRAIAEFSDDSTLDITEIVTWQSDDPDIAQISNEEGSEGIASALSAGTTEIVASFDGQEIDRSTVQVNALVLESIVVEPASTEAQIGESGFYSATGNFNDGSSLDITNDATWSTNDTSVATISNDPNDKARAVAVGVGSTTVTAQLEGESGTAQLNVIAESCGDEIPVSIFIVEGHTIAVGETVQFLVTGVYADGCEEDLTYSNQTTWKSKDKKIADIGNKTGIAIGLKAGAAEIEAKYRGLKDTEDLTVVD